jgi:hypothetical protein
MTLKYKILWFEDDDDVIKEDVGPLIKTFLIERGFDLNIIHHLNGEKLNDLIKDRSYDLIVTDLNLGEHETGDVLIDHIREGNILTEVLLYSANANEINKIVEEKGWIERASFCVGLGNLAEKLRLIVSLSIKKNQDVNNVRGLVISETIDLEHKIEKILLIYFSAAAEELLDERKKTILEEIHLRKIKKHEEDIEEIKKVSFTEVQSLIEKDILTASNSFDAIHSILKEKIKDLNVALNSKGLDGTKKAFYAEKKEELTSIKGELNTFREEVLKIRNTLAHVKEEVDQDGVSFLHSRNADGTEIKFDNNKYIEIRKNLRKHNENLDKILGHMG